MDSSLLDQSTIYKKIYIIGYNKFQNQLLSFFLETKFSCKCECYNKIEIFSEIQAEEKILLMLDFSIYNKMYKSNTFDNFHTSQRNHFFISIINAIPEERIETAALEEGIHGIFYLNDPPATILKGIESIFTGALWFSRDVITKSYLQIKNSTPKIKIKDDCLDLTIREREILLLLSKGARNKDIAIDLGISLHTVKTHIYNIYRKIDVSNRMQALVWASRFASLQTMHSQGMAEA